VAKQLHGMDQDVIWYGDRPRPNHIVLDGDPAPPTERDTAAPRPLVYCGETAGWIRVPLGTEVGLATDASASSIAFSIHEHPRQLVPNFNVGASKQKADCVTSSMGRPI